MKSERKIVVYLRVGCEETLHELSEADLNAIIGKALGGDVIAMEIETIEVGKTHLRPNSEGRD